jgi:DNA-binding transcriptional regulator LsrR (DeoR family)
VLDFQQYKEKLEHKHTLDLKDILADYYLKRDMGPSSTAKELGVPRQVVQHYINLFGLTEAKQDFNS